MLYITGIYKKKSFRCMVLRCCLRKERSAQNVLRMSYASLR